MKVLILSADIGVGHEAVARAVAHDVIDAGGEARIENTLWNVSPFLNREIASIYRFQLTHAPWTYTLLYDAVAKYRILTRFVKWLCGHVGGKTVRGLIDSYQPDMVLSTYPLASAMLAWLRRKGKLPELAVTVVADFAPHSLWAYPELDLNFLMHERSRSAIRDLEKIKTEIAGPPVAAKFRGPGRREQTRRELGVGPSEFVVLIVGGGWGVGDLAKPARVAANLPNTRSIIVCGRNEELYRNLVADPPPSTTVLGFVENMPDLLDAADVLIQNAGGVTCLEAIERECPLVLTDPIPGHGKANARLMHEAGVAVLVNKSKELPKVLAQIKEGASPVARGKHAMPHAAPVVTMLAGVQRRIPAALRGGRRSSRRWRLAAPAVAALVALMLTNTSVESFAATHLKPPAVRKEVSRVVKSVRTEIREIHPRSPARP